MAKANTTVEKAAETSAENTAETVVVKKNTIQDNIDRMNETVTINLFFDGDKYKDDVLVRVDGKRYQIRRGVDVQVPRKVADVIEQQLKQDKNTAAMIRKLENDYFDNVEKNLK